MPNAQAVVTAEPMAEGAGARVRRAFPTPRLRTADPFVLLDEFFVEPPAGFPEHPHRGFEIITYMLDGAFRHRDSLGNDRTIPAGGLQRITAGRGIWHAEMPGQEGLNHGLQLWINLPRRLKGVDPEYQEVAAGEIPEDTGEGYRVRIVVGDRSPVRLHTPVQYLDVAVEAGHGWETTVPPDHRGFVYVLVGEGQFGPGGDVRLRPGQLLLVGEGEPVRVRAGGDEPLRFVLVTGRPHGEPIRLRGPFVD
ncbi:pirin family protein [Caldinitratiruptor microaerophilus]|uniref:Pirin n=1 Tax=Caldinitratiruptor microaerophilus TaxID=671077 RepID=A0AA35GBJ7_9FIRM|nr:pirin family protein [Caldinitratiruptor microaerophilus]BDG62389.1 hypothetical protein caldi_34790 [Caldinitratiruptor microaerophilus]